MTTLRLTGRITQLSLDTPRNTKLGWTCLSCRYLKQEQAPANSYCRLLSFSKSRFEGEDNLIAIAEGQFVIFSPTKFYCMFWSGREIRPKLSPTGR